MIIRSIVGLVYAFLLLPMVVVVMAAFNAGNYFTFPPQGFSLKWFANFFQRREFMQALWLSTELAIWTALASTVIGTAAAIVLVRGRFRGRDLLNAFVTSPLLLPQILTGVALLQFYTLLKMHASYSALLIGHIVVTTPYVIRTVTATLTHFDIALEEAAQSLGANPVRAFLEITLGVIKPGVVAGAIFAFAISFDNFTLSLFLTSAKLTPLPIELFAYLKYSFDPTAAAHETLARLVEGDPSVYRSERTLAYDHASGTEIAVELTRGRRAKALIETSDHGLRVTALDFGLRIERRQASSAEYYCNRALGAVARTGRGRPVTAAWCCSAARCGGEIRRSSTSCGRCCPAPVGVIATASAEPEAVARETVALLERHGISAVALDASRDLLAQQTSARQALVERIGMLGSFLITGGNQRRLIEGLLFRGEETAVLRALGEQAGKQGATIVAVERRGLGSVAADDRRRHQRRGAALRRGAGDESHPGLLVDRAGSVSTGRHPRPEHAGRPSARPADRGLCGGGGAVRLRSVLGAGLVVSGDGDRGRSACS